MYVLMSMWFMVRMSYTKTANSQALKASLAYIYTEPSSHSHRGLPVQTETPTSPEAPRFVSLMCLGFSLWPARPVGVKHPELVPWNDLHTLDDDLGRFQDATTRRRQMCDSASCVLLDHAWQGTWVVSSYVAQKRAS